MRRFICSILAFMICCTMLPGAAPVTVSAADDASIHQAGYCNGVASGIGRWDFRPDRIANLKDGETTSPTLVPGSADGENVIAMEHISDGQGSWYDQSVLTWQTTTSPLTNLLAGEFELSIGLQPMHTEYPTTVKLRMANANSGASTADFIGLDVLSLGGADSPDENTGAILVGGEQTGYYYQPGEEYSFKAVVDPANDTYSVYLVSGPVSAEADGTFEDAGEEILLGEASDINNRNFGFVRTIDFLVTGLPADEDKGDITYINNISVDILPYRAYLKEEASAGDTSISLGVSHWVEAKSSKSTALADKIYVKRNGIALEENTDYTVTASYCARSTLSSFSRNPVITLTEPISGGESFEIDFGDISDFYGRKVQEPVLKFRVSAEADDKLGLALEALDGYITGENADFDNIISDLNLVRDIDGVSVEWTSSDTTVIDTEGHVTRPASFRDAVVTLTAELSYEGKTFSRVYECVVKTTYDPMALENAMNALTDALILGENTSLEQITQNLTLPLSMEGNVEISWMSSNKKAIDTDGTVVRPDGYNDSVVLLTATLTDGIGIYTKKFSCVVKTTFDPNRPPVVTDIVVSGIERVGNTLELSYTFDDINKLGDISVIQWEYSADGVIFTAIADAISKSYTINSAYAGGYLRASILPKNNAEIAASSSVYSDIIGPVLEASSINGGSGGSSGGSSGGNSGGGSVGSKGGNSVGGVVSFTPPANPQNAAPEKYSFMDVPQSHWAADSVDTLVSAGVISCTDNRLFRPDENVTRAEFVKMVVVALDIEDADGVGGFTDMEESHWSYKYAAAALDAGIVTGYEDGAFRGSQHITREEIAVILNRAMKLKNQKDSDGSPVDFVDSEDISDFARDSIANMSAAGIINGMPDGRFLPQAKATRAQAAKMIGEVYANV